MKQLMALSVLGGAMLPQATLAHVTGDVHVHNEHGAAWLVGVALIAMASAVALRRMRAERRS